MKRAVFWGFLILLSCVFVLGCAKVGLRLAEIAVRNGFPFVPCTPEMAEYSSSKKVYLHGFRNSTMGEGHMNEQGHMAAAEALMDAVRQAMVKR